MMTPITRRELLSRMGGGFGLLGMAGTLATSVGAAPAADPLGLKPPHFAPRAKHVILLMLNGGLSQVDSFDRKPMLDKYHGQPFPGGNPNTERKTGNLMRSPFTFKKYGQSGIDVSEIFPYIGESIDDFCVVRSMHTEVPNHEPSLYMMTCGSILKGRPALGSWLTYGLGTENQNLPGFVVLCPENNPIGGAPQWSSAFLPAIYQGTLIKNTENDPQKIIPFIENKSSTLEQKRRQVDLLERINRLHQRRREDNPQLEASIRSMEVAYRMQTEALQAFDLTRESEATKEAYGNGDFARGCLMARRLVEHGVRMVQVYFAANILWDNHEDIMLHRKHALNADRPIAALIKDLKARGLFDETLVIVGSEFGRTPSIEVAPGLKVHNGRDHNPYGFTILMAGGGVKGGMTYGATDDFGFYATENKVHVHDLHATILHLLGVDHTKLTYRYSGRDFRLTDVEGNVIKDIIA
jgi:hypothetical protein